MENLRQRYTPLFKAKVAIEAIREQKTSSELASEYQVHPNQIRNWKSIATKGLADLFADKRKKAERDQEELIQELYRQLNQMHSEKETNQSDEGENESGGNRTMGRKHVVDYGIYRSYIYFSPAFAAKTGFTYYDLDNFLFALQHMFTDDRAAARPGGMRVVGLVDFQHSTPLGNKHAHKLFEMVKVHRADVDEEGNIKKEFPQTIADYCGEAPHGPVREKDQGGADNELVTVSRIIWEIPACQGEKCTMR